MPLPAHYAQARVLFRSPQNDTGINVLWYELSGAPANAQAFADALAVQLDTNIAGSAKSVITGDSAYFGVAVVVNTTGGAFNAFGNAGAGSGSVEGDELPAYAAAVIQKRTTTGGKEGRGRWYVPFVPETMTDEGLLTETAEESYQTLADNYMISPSILTITCTASHWSEKLGFLLPITSVNANAVLGTQRRRRLRGSY